MLTTIVPKLPMRNKSLTGEFYLNQLGFEDMVVQTMMVTCWLKKITLKFTFPSARGLV